MLAGLFLLTLAAAGMRLAFLSHGLPHQREDDAIIVQQGQALELDPGASVSPLYPNMLARGLVLLPGRLGAQAASDAGLEEHLAAASRPFLIGRYAIALLSILAVPGTFLLARRFMGGPWALLAAAFVAFSLLHLAHSRQARPHGALATFTVFALLGNLCILRSGSVRAFAGAGLASALSIGTLHSGLAVLPALATTSFLYWRTAQKPRLVRLLIPLLLAALALALFYPFLFDGTGFFAKRKIVEEEAFRGEGFPRMVRSILAWEPVLALTAAFGALVGLPLLARGLRRFTEEPVRDVLVLLSFALPYFTAIGLYGMSWHRFLMPLLPPLACLAAYGARRLVALASRPLRSAKAQPALAAAVSAALLALPLAACARWTWLQSRPDSCAAAAEWIRANAGPRSRILASYLVTFPLWVDPEDLRLLKVPAVWERYQLDLDGRHSGETYAVRSIQPGVGRGHVRLDEQSVLAFLESAPADLAVVIVPHAVRAVRDQTPAAVRARGGELVHRIVPYESRHLVGTDGGRDWLDYEPLRVALTAERMGPLLEIYRLPSPAAAGEDL